MQNPVTPTRIGRFEIKVKVGQGGMGAVYRAHDPVFGRDVAVKVLPSQLLSEPTFRARFEREARLIASLEHPAIVPVYDFGDYDGVPYLVMRLMSGGSLADRLRAGPLPVHETARIFAALAPALDQAHARGIIHRDLKPANILFDENANPYLADFGVARLAQASSTMTATGLIGTPAYMSPEQAVGDKNLDARTDLYALGVIVYQMLTGQLPYEADNPFAVVMKQVNAPVPRASALRPDLPEMADHIIGKAMAKQREARYENAAGLAADLATLPGTARVAPPPSPPIMDLPTLAVPAAGALGDTRLPPGLAVPTSLPPEPPTGLARPNPPRLGHRGVLVAGSLLVLGMVPVGLAAIVLIYLLARGGLTPAVTQTPPAPPATATLLAGGTHTVVAASTHTASVTATPVPASPTAAETRSANTASAPIASDEPAEASGLIAFVSSRVDSAEIYVMKPDGTDPQRLTTNVVGDFDPAWSPDGRQIAFYSSRGGNADIYLMNSDGTGEQRLTTHEAGDWFPAWSPDGSQIAFTSDRDGTRDIYIMNADGSNQQALTNASGNDRDPVWSPDGRQIAFTATRDGNRNIYLMNADGSNQRALTTNPASDWFPVWSPDGRRILFVSDRDGNPEVYVISIDSAEEQRLTDNAAPDYEPAWSPQGTHIVFASERDGNPEIYVMAADGSNLRRLTDNTADDSEPAWSPLPPGDRQ